MVASFFICFFFEEKYIWTYDESQLYFSFLLSMLSPNYRYIALDFETTGLDLQSDEPIQIGILECDAQGNFIAGYQSLLRPSKPTKELKTVVGFITGLSADSLQDAPTPAEVEPEIQHFFWPNTIIVWHNIAFDLHFLQKFFPSLTFADAIDSFKLSQSLLHYVPSYAQEILIAQLQSKPDFQKFLISLKFSGELNFHDAFVDAKLSLALFCYLLDKIQILIAKYPILEHFISQSEWRLAQLIQKSGKNQTLLSFSLPELKKITPPHTQMISGKYPFDLAKYRDRKSYQIRDVDFKDLLSSLASQKNIILAFSTKAKLDIAKNLLTDLWIKNLWFAKEEQTLSTEALDRFAKKGKYSEAELVFLLKYFSHLEQGLGVLDLNSKEDYEIYTALKDQRKTVNYPIVLTTHGGLFSLIEQGRYQDYSIFFFDSSWWYKSFNTYLSRPYDLNYTLNFLDMLAYKYYLALEYSDKTKEEVWILTSFIEFFTVFAGILGQETKKFFTHTDATTMTLDPIKDNVAFYQTNKLLERFSEFKSSLSQVLDEAEIQTLRKQIDHMFKIFESMCVVEKKMYSRSDFYFLYSEEVKFTTRAEFSESFWQHKTLFLSNYDLNLPALIEVRGQQTQKIEWEEEQMQNSDSTTDKLMHLSKTASVLKFLEDFDTTKIPNALIFILSVQKDQSRELFEEMIHKGLDQKYLLLVENITWWSGKNLFKAKTQGAKVIIWGYNFLLQLFAQKLAISQLIVYNSKGAQQDLIFNDIVRYGRENLR